MTQLPEQELPLQSTAETRPAQNVSPRPGDPIVLPWRPASLCAPGIVVAVPETLVWGHRGKFGEQLSLSGSCFESCDR